MIISSRFHIAAGINTYQWASCAVSVTEFWYTMKSLVVIFGLLVAAVQVNNFKIQLFMTVIFELAIELWTFVVQNSQN